MMSRSGGVLLRLWVNGMRVRTSAIMTKLPTDNCVSRYLTVNVEVAMSQSESTNNIFQLKREIKYGVKLCLRSKDCAWITTFLNMGMSAECYRASLASANHSSFRPHERLSLLSKGVEMNQAPKAQLGYFIRFWQVLNGKTEFSIQQGLDIYF